VAHFNKRHLPTMSGEQFLRCKRVVKALLSCEVCGYVCNGPRGINVHQGKKGCGVAGTPPLLVAVAPPVVSATEGDDTGVRQDQEIFPEGMDGAGTEPVGAGGAVWVTPPDLGLEEVKLLLPLFNRAPQMRRRWIRPFLAICGCLIEGIVGGPGATGGGRVK
jgi:hypothetical protein